MRTGLVSAMPSCRTTYGETRSAMQPIPFGVGDLLKLARVGGRNPILWVWRATPDGVAGVLLALQSHAACLVALSAWQHAPKSTCDIQLWLAASQKLTWGELCSSSMC